MPLRMLMPTTDAGPDWSWNAPISTCVSVMPGSAASAGAAAVSNRLARIAADKGTASFLFMRLPSFLGSVSRIAYAVCSMCAACADGMMRSCVPAFMCSGAADQPLSCPGA